MHGIQGSGQSSYTAFLKTAKNRRCNLGIIRKFLKRDISTLSSTTQNRPKFKR
tara:strand:- start:6029 stop:6187 length:159 start_codon:yes stop_codon:yes gene_type:complete